MSSPSTSRPVAITEPAEALPGAGSLRELSTGALGRTRLRSTPGFYERAWYQFRQNKTAVAGLILSILIVLFVLAAGIISRVTGYTFAEGDLANQFLNPGQGGHVLGTDANGRDVLVRAAYGGRISLLVASLAAALGIVISTTVGAVSGYFGGWTDAVLMRVVDVLLCIPGLPLLILVFSVFRPGPVMLAVVIALLGWAGGARLIRGEMLSLRRRDYVDAARVLGASDARIIFRHLIPNVIPLLIVSLSLALPGLILVEAALSFLGFGIQIPTPSWGNMLENAREYFARSWSNVLIPGLFIYLTVLAISLVGNGLRDAFDPRLSR